MKHLRLIIFPLLMYFSIPAYSASPIERVRLYGNSGQLVSEKNLLGNERVYLILGRQCEDNDQTSQQQVAMALFCQLRYEIIPYNRYGDIWLVARGQFGNEGAIHCQHIPSIRITRLNQKTPVSGFLDYVRFFTPELIHWITSYSR